MNFIDYIKEKWLTYTFISVCFLFELVVYKLDYYTKISEESAEYILSGLVLFLICFAIIDYMIFNSRIKKFRKYCRLNASSQRVEDFDYKLDREYAELVLTICLDYEEYKAEMYTKTEEDIAFVTRWVHDVKVPISAIRMILEGNEGCISETLYRHIDTEISRIQHSTENLFYKIKSNNFIEDYKVSTISVKKLLIHALKKYSNIVSYKKLRITVEVDDYSVLTDEKWSGYIISQILSNAVKYTPIEGSIIISATKKGEAVTLSFKNTGSSIESKDIGQVFNKAYTASKNRDGMNSTGYGMYLSKILSDKLGHKLRVHSAVDVGTTFELTFLGNVTKM